jgi:hypothetical protein
MWVGKRDENRPLETLEVDDNIKMLLLRNGFGVNWIHLFKGQFRAVVNTAMNLQCQDDAFLE